MSLTFCAFLSLSFFIHKPFRKTLPLLYANPFMAIKNLRTRPWLPLTTFLSLANVVFGAVPIVDFDRMGTVGLAVAFAGLGLFDNSSSSSVPPMFTPTSDADLPLLTPSLTPDLAPSDEFVCPLTDATEPTTGSPNGAPLVSSLGPPLVSPLGPPLPSASYQMPVIPTVPPPITTDCQSSRPNIHSGFPFSSSVLNSSPRRGIGR